MERTLLDHRVAVLHGFGDAGKTALAREAALWLTRTGMFPGGVRRPFAAGRPLGGFSPRDALDFAAVILGKEGIPRDRLDKEALQQLMDLLGNHALSLSLVLPKLKTMDLGQMLQEFETLLLGFKTGEGSAFRSPEKRDEKRDESLQVSLDFSLRRLGEETRRLLPSLAVFQGGGWERNILKVTQIPPETWNAVRPELQRAALIRAEELPGGTVPFIHFHPTLGPHLSRLLPGATRAKLETRYRQAYYEFAKTLYFADPKTPMQIRSLALREIPNLKRGLTLMLAAGEVNTAVDFATRIVRFLNIFGR